jgi:hypothetical protein
MPASRSSLGTFLLGALLVGCGASSTPGSLEKDAGKTTERPNHDAASEASTGEPLPEAGALGSVLPDCATPLPSGACASSSPDCGGPCSNSWQAHYVCQGGKWEWSGVTACGPDRDRAPQCKNAFEGGRLTPCCAAGGLSCAGQPDNYPGFGCTPGDGSFCSCSCQGGIAICGC